MKSISKFIFLLISLLPLAAYAGGPDKYFEIFATHPDFDYTYISPLMLQAMGRTELSQESSGGLQLYAQDLTSIETVSTIGEGENETLRKIIKKIKNDKKLETLSTQKKMYYRYDIYGKLSNDKKYITNLMVITQNGGENVMVLYMEGKIPLQTLQYTNIED